MFRQRRLSTIALLEEPEPQHLPIRNQAVIASNTVSFNQLRRISISSKDLSGLTNQRHQTSSPFRPSLRRPSSTVLATLNEPEDSFGAVQSEYSSHPNLLQQQQFLNNSSNNLNNLTKPPRLLSYSSRDLPNSFSPANSNPNLFYQLQQQRLSLSGKASEPNLPHLLSGSFKTGGSNPNLLPNRSPRLSIASKEPKIMICTSFTTLSFQILCLIVVLLVSFDFLMAKEQELREKAAAQAVTTPAPPKPKLSQRNTNPINKEGIINKALKGECDAKDPSIECQKEMSMASLVTRVGVEPPADGDRSYGPQGPTARRSSVPSNKKKQLAKQKQINKAKKQARSGTAY